MSELSKPRRSANRRGHPWLFVLSVFMAAGAFGSGAFGWGLVLVAVAVGLLVWRL